MGIAGSKDDRGVRVLQALPPGFLDDKGKELRNNLDYCLERNGWYFTIAGLALSIPICFKYKTERPFYVAAILSPMADMYYGTLRCTKENDAFAKHYRYLHKRYQMPAYKQGELEALEQEYQQQQQQGQQHQGQPPGSWRPQWQQGSQEQQQQQWAGGSKQPRADEQQRWEQQQQQQQQQHAGEPPDQKQPARRWWWIR